VRAGNRLANGRAAVSAAKRETASRREMDMCEPKLVLVASERKVAAVSAVWSLGLTAVSR